MNETELAWNRHYTRPEADLELPDETVVRIFAHLARAGKFVSAPRLLDFGCGGGRNGLYLKRMGYLVDFSDITDNALNMVRAKLSASPQATPSRVLKSAIPLAAADAYYDIILAWGVFHYLDARELADWLAELRRVAKPGAILCASLRADTDTQLGISDGRVALAPIAGARARLFTRGEVENLFAAWRDLRLGYLERRPPGEMDTRICHFVAQAEFP